MTDEKEDDVCEACGAGFDSAEELQEAIRGKKESSSEDDNKEEYSDDVMDVVELRRKNKTYKDIADILDIGTSTVYRRLHKHHDETLLKRGENVREMSEINKSYVAGIVDGEGCLTMTKQFEENGVNINTTIKVNMASEEVIDKLVECTGLDKKYVLKHTSEREDRKTQYGFRIYSIKQVKQFLDQIQPYLIEKEEQAEKLLKYCRERKTNHTYTDEELSLVKEVQELNNE